MKTLQILTSEELLVVSGGDKGGVPNENSGNTEGGSQNGHGANSQGADHANCHSSITPDCV